MKVLLIIPPYPIEEYPAPSTGAMSLAAALLREGCDVEILDLLVSEPCRGKVARAVSRFDPDIVGITSVTMTFPIAAEILAWVQSCKPEAARLMGGPHVSFAAERSLRECAAADVIVRGEGEESVVDLIHRLRRDGDLNGVRGISFRRGAEIISTGPRGPARDLNALPPPAWHLLPLARYRALQAKVGVLSSRGCPHGCAFCVGHRMMGRRGRFRDPIEVVDEMALLAGCGFSSVGIDDDLFTLRPQHALAVCEELRSRRLPITWHAFARVDSVNPELLAAMSEAGCTDICYGVESGSQQILNRVGKGITTAQAKRAVQMGGDAGIRILASFILGLPGETRATLRQTAEFARGLGCRFGFHVLAPFPGSKVREEADRFGITVLTDDWALYDANHPVCLTANIDPEDIHEILDRYHGDVQRYCLLQARRVRSGQASLEDREAIVRRERRGLAWEILRRDLIEKEGAISAARSQGEAMAALCRRLTRRLPATPAQVLVSGLQAWTEEGLLRCEPEGGNWIWRWATTRELLKDARAPGGGAR